jgi:hypothetical protein
VSAHIRKRFQTQKQSDTLDSNTFSASILALCSLESSVNISFHLLSFVYYTVGKMANQFTERFRWIYLNYVLLILVIVTSSKNLSISSAATNLILI